MDIKHKFTIFNSADYKDGTNNKDGYYTICLEDLNSESNIQIIGGPMPEMPKFAWYLILICRKLGLNYGNFFKIFTKGNTKGLKDCVLVMKILDPVYLTWLRIQNPKSKFILFLRDLYETKEPYVSIYKNEHLIDIWGSYDQEEQRKYNMDFFYPEIESQLDFSEYDLTPTCDVFFAGAAKKRLPQLLEAYDYLTQNGIKCFFIIMDANEQESDLREGIKYTTELIPYRQMLLYSLRCKCMLEINQEGAVGNTSRFLEAVMYNKKLISNSTCIIKEHFYNPDYIKIFKKITDVDPAFITEDINVNYNYNNEFSPRGLIECIDKLI